MAHTQALTEEVRFLCDLTKNTRQCNPCKEIEHSLFGNVCHECNGIIVKSVNLYRLRSNRVSQQVIGGSDDYDGDGPFSSPLGVRFNFGALFLICIRHSFTVNKSKSTSVLSSILSSTKNPFTLLLLLVVELMPSFLLLGHFDSN